ncbi:uncharacterized protein N7484_007465 [Penicillium longicatenatum]|uniref:uncharacterized protein n=1 Tax=Penicillium longicatenatum TaxID=1561947 RepID=UPI002548AF0A|nr:uncharacterized protein N7484_007465 [Penicillium longicatenatum]KAJ5639603.1 hypothetical protein N7484_007465 [Penicillium longicatenatum]
MGYLGQIFAHIGDDESSKPSNIISVVDGNGADINGGFGGKFVWLIANFHNHEPSAISQIAVDIQDQQDNGRRDLASGAGGQFRYLAWRTDGAKKITNVQVLRRKDQVSWDTLRGLGFEGMSNDINGGRGGDFLHLVWKY